MFNELNNTKRTVKEGIKTEDMEFQPLKNFVGNTINVDGFFFTNSKYGKQIVVVGNGALINMPKRALEQFETINNNEDMLKAVLDGKMIIKDIAPITTKNGDSVSYTLADR